MEEKKKGKLTGVPLIIVVVILALLTPIISWWVNKAIHNLIDECVVYRVGEAYVQNDKCKEDK